MIKKIINFLKNWLEEEESIRIDIISTPHTSHPKYWDPLPVDQETIYVIEPLSPLDWERKKKKFEKAKKEKKG